MAVRLFMRWSFFTIIISLISGSDFAMAVTSQNLDGPGAIRGGQSEQYMSLLDIRRSSDKKQNTDRIVIDWGNRYFERTDRGGYYQIEYREKPLQLVISFSLTLNTKFENQLLNKKIGHGLYLKDMNLEFDSLSQAILLTLNLKQKVKIKVTDYGGSAQKKTTAKLALDLIGFK